MSSQELLKEFQRMHGEALKNKENYELTGSQTHIDYYQGYADAIVVIVSKLDLQDESEDEPETVARVILEYMKAAQRFKEILGMEVEELEE